MATSDSHHDGSPRLDGAVVMLRPVGSALPLGLAGLAIASLLFTGLDFGWVPQAQRHELAATILAAAVPLETVAFLFALVARDGAAASAVALLAAAWGSIGVVHAMSPPGSTSDALGLALLAIGALLLLSTPAQALGKPLAAAAFGLAGARFVLTGLHELTARGGWQDASGAVGLAVVAVAAYAIVAFELEDAKDQPVLPTFRRGRGRNALAAPAEAQLDGVAHEPGVRQQL
jgi:hypothetical protein